MAYTKDISLVTLMLAKNYTQAYVKDHQGTAASAVEGTITLGTNWSGNGPWTQAAGTAYTVTGKTRVDLQPDPDIVSQLTLDGVSQIIVKNNSGALTAYSFGGKPSAALTIPVFYSEVE